MIKDLARLAQGIARTPASTAFALVRKLRTSKHAVVHVTVEGIADVHSRELWLQDVRRLGEDPHVEAVVFHVRAAPGGWAACQDLRSAIAGLRLHAKPTYAFLESPGNAAMWIATACQRVFAVPTGEILLVGVGVEMMFFGQALERVGLQPDLEAAGTYKSFGEPFTRSFASKANLEATEALVGDLHRQLLSDIASDRGLEPAALDAVLAKAPVACVEAVVDGLVDQILYTDQLDEWLVEQHGKSARRVDFDDWASLDRKTRWIDAWGRGGGRVAVLHLEGAIVMDDKSGKQRIRARTVAPMVEELRKDDDVSAVVLHVNSPGGDAVASDLIWREVEKLRTSKPVVACFEDVSASGGFYLSAPATEIFARAATLTGSIGVFGGKFVATEGLRKVGVTTQSVLAAPNANLFSPSSRFTDAQRVRFREKLQRFYDGFVHRVAAGRKQPEDVIEKHCRGRVWTGRQALEHGLIDRLGDLDDAVARAKVLAGLKPRALRSDLSGQPAMNVLQRLALDARKQVMPAAQLQAATALLDRWIDPELASWTRLMLDHEHRPMAMLPFLLRIR